ncbi:hypothetical protein BDR26DRAFT_869917, partial [Obelidium mucronatum]
HLPSPKPDQAPPPIPTSSTTANDTTNPPAFSSGAPLQSTPFMIPQRVRSKAPPARTERSLKPQPDPRLFMAKDFESKSTTGSSSSSNDREAERKGDTNGVIPRNGSPLGPPRNLNQGSGRGTPEVLQTQPGISPLPRRPVPETPSNALGRALPFRPERSDRAVPLSSSASPPRQEGDQQTQGKEVPVASSDLFIPKRSRASSVALFPPRLNANNSPTPPRTATPDPVPAIPFKQDQSSPISQQRPQQSSNDQSPKQQQSTLQQQQQQQQQFPSDPQQQQQLMQQQNAQMQIWARTVKAHHDSKIQAVKAQQAAEERVRELEAKLKARDAELLSARKKPASIENLTRNQRGELEELESLQEEYEKLAQKQTTTLESLKSAQAKIQAFETRTVSLKTELANKEKRVESMSSYIKDTEKRLMESQAQLRENNGKLRKLRGDRGSVMSEASVHTSRRVKSLRQGLVELEVLKQMEIDELRTTLIELLKEKDEEIDRLTSTLKRQVSSNGNSENGDLLETVERQNSKIASLERKLVGLDISTANSSANNSQNNSSNNRRQTLQRLKSLESSNKYEVEGLMVEIKELKNELEDMRNGYEDAEFRYEAQQIQHETYLVDLEGRHNLEIKDLKDKLDTMRIAFDDERDSLLTDLFNAEGALDGIKKMHSKEIKAIVQKHSAQIEEIKAQMERSLNSNVANNAANSGLNSSDRIEALKTAKARLEVTLTTSLQEKRELDRQLRSLGEQLESQIQENSTLKDQVNLLKGQCQYLQEATVDSQSLLNTANAKLASITSQMESLNLEFNKDTERYKEDIQVLEDSRAALEAELNESNDEFVGMIEKLRSLESTNLNLEKEVEVLKAVGTRSVNRDIISTSGRNVDDSQVDLVKAREKITLLEGKNSKLLDIISSINVSSEKAAPASPTLAAESQINKVREEYDAKLKSAYREIEALREEVDQLSQDYDLVDVELKTLKLQANSASSSNDRISSEAKVDLENQIVELKEKLVVAKNEIELLETANDASKWSLSEAQDSLEKERVLAMNAKAESDGLKSEIAGLNEKLNNAILDLKDANDYMDELEREIARLTSEVPESVVSIRSPPRSTTMSPRNNLSPTRSDVPDSILSEPRELVVKDAPVTLNENAEIQNAKKELEDKLQGAINEVENLKLEKNQVLVEQLKLTEEHSISTREQSFAKQEEMLSTIEALELELQEAQAKMNTAASTTALEGDSLSKNVDDSEERNEQFQSQINEYLASIKTLEHKIRRPGERLDDQCVGEGFRVEALQAELDGLSMSSRVIDELEAKIVKLTLKFEVLESKYLTQGLKFESFEIELKRSSNTISTLMEQEEHLRQVISELEQKLADAAHQSNQARETTREVAVSESVESSKVAELESKLQSLALEYADTDDQIAELQEQDAKLSWAETALANSKKETRDLEAIYLTQGLKLESLQAEVSILFAKQELISSTDGDELLDQLKIVQQEKATLLNELEILEQDASTRQSEFAKRELELQQKITTLEEILETCRQREANLRDTITSLETESQTFVSRENELEQKLATSGQEVNEKNQVELQETISTLENVQKYETAGSMSLKRKFQPLEMDKKDISVSAIADRGAVSTAEQEILVLQTKLDGLAADMDVIYEEKLALLQSEELLVTQVAKLNAALDASRGHVLDLEAKYLTQGTRHELTEKHLSDAEAKLLVLSQPQEDNSSSESGNEIVDLKAELRDALLDLKDANDYMDELEQEIARLNAQKAENNASTSAEPSSADTTKAFESKIQELQGALDKAKSQALESEAKYKAQSVELESALTELASSIDPSTIRDSKKIQDMQILIDELTMDVETNQEQNEKLQRKLDVYLDEIDELQNTVQSLKSALASSTEKSVQLETKLSESEDEREAGASNSQGELIQGLQDQVRSLKSTNSHIFSQLKESEEKVQRLVDQLNSVGSESNDKDAQKIIQNAFEQVAKLNVEKDLLLEQNESLLRRLEEGNRATPEVNTTNGTKKKGYFF